ncbi:CAP domain-containing protein [Yoonia sp. BS5-3]|uniref:CAP domain-containing protein n=1 Tax=Yoonia phaeophyticola TaxID=3137369 RepID=A0ABZ2V451_9RHOB
MNSEFGAGLNALRMQNGANDVFYDATVGRAAQIHANDMYTNDHLSIFLGDDPTAFDMGDTLAQTLGMDWNEIGQYIAKGDYDTDTVLTEWETNGSQGDGDNADKLTFTNMDLFGIAKAGSGTDSRWVLLLVDN